MSQKILTVTHWGYKAMPYRKLGGHAKRGKIDEHASAEGEAHHTDHSSWRVLDWPGVSTLMMAFIVVRAGYGTSNNTGRMQLDLDRVKMSAFADCFMGVVEQATLNDILKLNKLIRQALLCANVALVSPT